MILAFPHKRSPALRRASKFLAALWIIALFFPGAADSSATSEIASPVEQTQSLGELNAVEPDLPVNPETATPLPAAPAWNTTEAVSPVERRFRYTLRLTIRGLYDDNINVSQTNRVSDFITAIEPGVMLGVGDVIARQENYLGFEYAPSIFLYNEHTKANAVQHLVHLDGQYRFSRLTMSLLQDIQILDGANLDIATNSGPVNDRINLDVSGRTKVNIFTTRLNAAYYLTGKTFLSSQLGATINDYESLISSRTIFGNLFLNYAFSQKLTVGVGGGAGYNIVDDPNPGERFEEANVRLTYDLSGKVTMNISAGVEFREGDQSSSGTYVSPVFQIGFTYQPFDGTSIRLDATRSTSSSAVLAGEDYSVTSFTVGARQRLLQRVYLGATVGFESSDYFSVGNGVSSNRTDHYYFLQPAIDVSVTRFWTVGAYYLRRHNSSSFDSFNFYDTQVGFRTSLTF